MKTVIVTYRGAVVHVWWIVVHYVMRIDGTCGSFVKVTFPVISNVLQIDDHMFITVRTTLLVVEPYGMSNLVSDDAKLSLQGKVR